MTGPEATAAERDHDAMLADARRNPVERCTATGPGRLRCDLAAGHTGRHERGPWVWRDEDSDHTVTTNPQ